MASNSTSPAGKTSTSPDPSSAAGGSWPATKPAARGSSSCEMSAAVAGQLSEQREDFQELLDDVGTSVANYCRKRPLVAGLSVFLAGFYVGWKIKPW